MGTRVSVLGLVALVVASAGLLAGCDSGGAGMGPMMGHPAAPASFRSNGERIYFTGASASGRPITFTGGDMRVQMHGGGCATCHGADRRGGIRMMPRVWVVAPPITPDALAGQHDGGKEGHGDHAAYTEGSLRRAITEGVDPEGKPLDEAMPRWRMHPDDVRDLVAYLRRSQG